MTGASASQVRAVLASDRVDQGLVSGYYARVGAQAAAVRAAWAESESKSLDRAALVETPALALAPMTPAGAAEVPC